MNGILLSRRSERLKKRDAKSPEKTVRQPRKRRMSTESDATIDSHASPSHRGRHVPPKREKMQAETPPRSSRNHSRAGSAFSTPGRQRLDSAMTNSPNPRDDWEQPKLGWCYDENILNRRAKVNEILFIELHSLTLHHFTGYRKSQRKGRLSPIYC